MDEYFINGGNDALERCLDEPWFQSQLADFPLTFEKNSAASSGFISSNVVGVCQEFKIGITEDPWSRWFRPDCGYCHDGWHRMVIMYCAPSSKPKFWDSTGSMEKRLIAAFAGRANGCINRVGAGGEGASAGPPHFTYVVMR